MCCPDVALINISHRAGVIIENDLFFQAKLLSLNMANESVISVTSLLHTKEEADGLLLRQWSLTLHFQVNSLGFTLLYLSLSERENKLVNLRKEQKVQSRALPLTVLGVFQAMMLKCWSSSGPDNVAHM